MNEHGYTFDQLNAWNKAKRERQRQLKEAQRIPFDELETDEAISRCIQKYLQNLKMDDLRDIVKVFKSHMIID